MSLISEGLVAGGGGIGRRGAKESKYVEAEVEVEEERKQTENIIIYSNIYIRRNWKRDDKIIFSSVLKGICF